jgi:4-diphosphocytidyl-2-C-methyl-D-erythritol kinase
LRIAPQLSPIEAAELSEVAAELGADVPAQMNPGLAIGTGAGEVVRPVPPLEPHSLAIVPLEQGLSTAAVYAEADRMRLTRSRDELEARLCELDRSLQGGDRLPPSLLANDLEPAARALCPAIEGALEAIRESGADAAFVCGSGPTAAGLYWGEEGGVRAGQAASRLSRRFPGASAVTPVPSQPSGKIRGR